MPYRINNDLPSSVRTHLPEHAQETCREAFNQSMPPMPATWTAKSAPT
jgi:cation transport regulator ChaB